MSNIKCEIYDLETYRNQFLYCSMDFLTKETIVFEVSTEVDDRLSYTILAKIVIGTGLGFFSCLTYMAYFPETVTMKLALPSFVLGCLGAPILVFLLTWASSKETWKKVGNKIDDKLGLEDELDK